MQNVDAIFVEMGRGVQGVVLKNIGLLATERQEISAYSSVNAIFVGLLTAAPMMVGAVSASHLPTSRNLSSVLNYTVNVVTVGNSVE